MVVSRKNDPWRQSSLQGCVGEYISLLVGKRNLVHEEASLMEYHALMVGKYFLTFWRCLLLPPVRSCSPSGTHCRVLY